MKLATCNCKFPQKSPSMVDSQPGSRLLRESVETNWEEWPFCTSAADGRACRTRRPITGIGRLKVTVIICTRNRAESLARTLESLHVSNKPADWQLELIVVDNGSSDDTPTTVAAWADRLPIKLVEEPTPGLSNARNAGVAAATGQYIIWTDDDVLVDRDWLCAYAQAFSRYPNVVVFGGRSMAELAPQTPAWFAECQDQLHDLLAIRNFGDEPVPLSTRERVLPFGLNYAVRTREQKRHRYDPNLGVAPGRSTGGEETALIASILAEGGEGLWLPGPLVRHLIPPARQSEAYIRSYYNGVGRLQALSSPVGVPQVARRAAKLVLSWAKVQLRPLVPARVWVGGLQDFSRNRGWFAQAFTRSTT